MVFHTNRIFLFLKKDNLLIYVHQFYFVYSKSGGQNLSGQLVHSISHVYSGQPVCLAEYWISHP